MSDEIHIIGLDLPTFIGVPDEERAHAQVLNADIKLTLSNRFEEMGDDLSKTLDYAALATQALAIAAQRPRRLIETLAADLMAFFLAQESVFSAEVVLRKRILPGTDHVLVRMIRTRAQ